MCIRDRAYAIIAEKAREVTEEYGPKSIVTGIGTGRNATWQTSSLAFAGFQTPNDTAGMRSGDCCYTPRPVSYTHLNFVGEITSLLEDEDLGMVAVSVLLRDGSGAIVGGYSGFVNNLAAGSTTSFDVLGLSLIHI